MFDDLMGNLENQQAEIKNKLQKIIVEAKADGIILTGNAARQITNISIAPALLQSQDGEMVEDLLISCFNSFIEKSGIVEAEVTRKFMSDILPPGFGDLFK
jgi:DNA-binding protein YbaB